MTSKKKPETRIIHDYFDPQEYGGVVNPPIMRASTILHKSTADFVHRLNTPSAKPKPLVYGRRGLPTTFALAKALTDLEQGYNTFIYPSGLAACITSLQCFVRSGDHVLISDNVYQPVRKFADHALRRLGVTCEYFDPRINAEQFAKKIQTNTSVLYLETPGSLTFELTDIAPLTHIAKQHGLTVLADNTWATPLFFNPFDWQIDVSIHALTKYVVGHADAIIGSATAANETIWQQLDHYSFAMGQCSCADVESLALRGLRTLPLRLKQHQISAYAVASWLAQQPQIDQVLYPVLASAPDHGLWAKYYSGATGLFTIVLKTTERAEAHRFTDRLHLFQQGYSWGGFESLALCFEAHSANWPYTGCAIRLHIGLEAVEDLIDDLSQALATLATT